ncbi:flagellar biosynthetic protein FliO [Paracidobacterium acidisoli]|nr:flagellar biosynthetic protein FliO [Paracidobacterium acidisoli]MBT9330298.1 flagellar biosynthetic protein FliO [Paracidobacterium acidisoli]
MQLSTVPLFAWCAKAVHALKAAARSASRRQMHRETRLSIEERLPLGQRKALMLVSCCGRQMLIAVSDETITPLMEVTEAAPTTGRSRIAAIPRSAARESRTDPTAVSLTDPAMDSRDSRTVQRKERNRSEAR